MAIKKVKRGGVRAGSGRKVLSDDEKRVPIFVYIKQKAVSKFKDKETLKKTIQEKVEAGLI